MELITDLIKTTLKGLQLPVVDFSVTHPKDEMHGDYSVNVAMILAKQKGKNPRELAQVIVDEIYKVTNFVKTFEKVEVAGPGFINFYLQQEFFVETLGKSFEKRYGENDNLKGQKTIVEFADPNPFKEFHIGHLMTTTIGESLARILELSGALVKRVNYQGDVGLHVAKSIWGWQKKMEIDVLTVGDLQSRTLKEQVNYMGQAYAYGSTKYSEDESAKAEMNQLNATIYKRTDPATNTLYDIGRTWSLSYFETIYKRLGTKFDHYFFESEAGPVGLKVIDEALEKGVLEVGDEGAIVFRGEQYGLHTRVFRNKLGLPTYEGKELGLAKSKYEFYPYDRSYVVTANEIDEYFKVLLKTLSLLYPELAAKTTHLSHGVMKLTTGKMSSRTGKVVTGEGLLNDLKEVVLTKMGERSFDSSQDKNVIADQVAVGALKYTVLKQAIGGDIVYDPEKMTNMDGDTGPYIQYTFARTQSLLRKANVDITRYGTLFEQLEQGSVPCNAEEMSILRWIYRYPEVVAEAGLKYAPHLIASYIYELAQRFNTFYNKHQILPKTQGSELSSVSLQSAESSEPHWRLRLTGAVGKILERGLALLGIQAPGEM